MTKTTLLIITCMLSSFLASSQVIDTVKLFTKPPKQPPFGNSFHFEGDFCDKSNLWQNNTFVVGDTQLYRIDFWLKLSDKNYVDSMRRAHPKQHIVQSRFQSKILLGVKLDPKLTEYISDGLTSGTKSYPGYTITNNSKALLVAMGINKNNVKDYRYHVVENDSIEIVHWSIPKLAQGYGAKAPYAMLGEFKDLNKQLLIEVVNVKDYSIKDGVIFNWKTNFKPSIGQVTIYAKNDYFDLRDTSANHHFATKFAPASQVPLNLKFRAGDIESMAISFNYHEPIHYTFYLIKRLSDHKTDTSQIAEIGATDGVYNFHRENYNQPGKYQLVVQPSNQWGDSQLLRIPFEVLEPLPTPHTYSMKQLAPYLIGTLLAVLVLFTGYYSYNKRKLSKANQQKALANLKLSSIRSQLNPHFMFNALTSIQNLMNQHDTAGANHYLSKFAALTRQILNTSRQEMISIEDELHLITDYLQMEQLRFGFEYGIVVSPEINKANTEIPNMLLQPFIENAARHGVGAMQSKGEINVSITRQQRNLVLKVGDNGGGFKEAPGVESGFGLKLSEERIRLLNQLYPDQPIRMNIDSSANGTTITITLTEWL